MGESSSDWWLKELETEETVSPSKNKEDSKICNCRSPIFKTPQLEHKKKKRKSCGRVLLVTPGQKRSRGEAYFIDIF
jgi:hypothetical protein